MPISLPDFIARWQAATLSERSAAQSYFNDLCDLLGQPKPAEADPTGAWYTFETYPFPWPPGKEPQGDPRVEAIAEAARELVRLRDNWLNPPDASEADLKKRTLTNLYNLRPTWLDNAHRRLDRAVLDAYAWPHDLTDEQILERLLALNLERAAQHSN